MFASRESGELRHTLWPITEQPQPTQTQIRLTAWLSAHAWQIRCSPDHPMLRPFTPHTHSFRPVRHAWRVITDPYDKMPMCDAARSLIGVLSPGSRHAPVDHGHTHTGLAISGQRGGDGHASIVCMAPIGTLTRAGTAKQLPAGRGTTPGAWRAPPSTSGWQKASRGANSSDFLPQSLTSSRLATHYHQPLHKIRWWVENSFRCTGGGSRETLRRSANLSHALVCGKKLAAKSSAKFQ